MKIFFAPLQGYTTAPYRRFHKEIYGGIDFYCAPFLHIEKGMPRQRDYADITSPLNEDVDVIPQILFRDFSEFEILTEATVKAGYNRIDLNCGCPFPPQTNRGRGAGFISNRKEFEKIADYIRRRDDIRFSLKMRPGKENADEWQGVSDIINGIPLEYVAVHPRVARQQYRGDLDYKVFEEMTQAIAYPLVFNGEIHSPQDIQATVTRFPFLHGIMIGRGLLGRPSLAAEWRGEQWSESRRLEAMCELHRRLFDHYSERLCGDSQLLSKMKSFWEYAEPEIGHKASKAIRKSTSVAAYLSAVASIGQ